MNYPKPKEAWAVWFDLGPLNYLKWLPALLSIRELGIDAFSPYWYCFLLHDGKDHGTGELWHEALNEDNIYIHLRLCTELTPQEVQDVAEANGAACAYQIEDELSSMDFVRSMKSEDAWRLLGESSAWVLRVLEATDFECKEDETEEERGERLRHDVGQMIHYIDNQLLACPVRPSKMKMENGYFVTEQVEIVWDRNYGLMVD